MLKTVGKKSVSKKDLNKNSQLNCKIQLAIQTMKNFLALKNSEKARLL